MSLFWNMLLSGGAGGLSVSPSTSNITKLEVGGQAYAVIQFNTSGVEYQNTDPAGTTADQSRGNWLDSGSSSDVWVEDASSGVDAWHTSAGAGRLNLGTTRTWIMSESVGIGTDVRNAVFNFYDAAAGGNLIGTASYTITAEWSV
jgi:hypothetical protein